MARVPEKQLILQGLMDNGLLVLEDGKCMLRACKTVESKLDDEGTTETEYLPVLIDVSDLVGLTEYSITKFVNDKDTVHKAKSEYRKQSERALKEGIITASHYDLLFGTGEAEKVLIAQPALAV